MEPLIKIFIITLGIIIIVISRKLTIKFIKSKSTDLTFIDAFFFSLFTVFTFAIFSGILIHYKDYNHGDHSAYVVAIETLFYCIIVFIISFSLNVRIAIKFKINKTKKKKELEKI